MTALVGYAGDGDYDPREKATNYNSIIVATFFTSIIWFIWSTWVVVAVNEYGYLGGEGKKDCQAPDWNRIFCKDSTHSLVQFPLCTYSLYGQYVGRI